MYSEAKTLKILMNVILFLLIATNVMVGYFLFNFLLRVGRVILEFSRVI